MRAWIGWLGVLALAASAGADVLETRDGRLLEGRYLGGTRQALRFEVAGAVRVIPIESVLALTFDASARAAAEAPAASGSPAATPSAPPALARVPAGTRLRVRLDDAIDPRRVTQDDRFAAVLETGLAAADTPILPVGTKVYGRIAELRATGPVASRMQLELDQLMYRGQLVPIVSGPHQVPAADAPGPANASTIPERPEFAAGSLLEFRLLQPVDLPLR
jgi:hypothetical protein